MMVFYSGYGRWGDYTGLYGALIKVSSVFELQHDERISIEITGKTHTDTLSPCSAHKHGAIPWIGEAVNEGDRDFFKIFRIDGKGGEFLEKALFTRQDIIDSNSFTETERGFTVCGNKIIPALYKALVENSFIKDEGLEQFQEAFKNGNGFIIWTNTGTCLAYLLNELHDKKLILTVNFWKESEHVLEFQGKHTSLKGSVLYAAKSKIFIVNKIVKTLTLL